MKRVLRSRMDSPAVEVIHRTPRKTLSMLRNDALNERTFDALGTILLSSPEGGQRSNFAREIDYICGLSLERFEGLLKQAEMQRVLRRCLEILRKHLPSDREDLAQIMESTLTSEQKRVQNLLFALQRIVRKFEDRGYAVLVMK